MNLITGYRMARLAQQGDNEGVMKLAVKAGLLRSEIDPNDPDFAPVQGIDVDEYARICKAIAHGGHTDEAALHRVLTDHGVDPAGWKAIAETWNERVMRSQPVKTRYAVTFLGD